MTNPQEEVELTRDVNATLIPHGEEFTLGSGEKVTITHRLGGNFTVMTLQGMYRISAKDADALGESLTEVSVSPIDISNSLWDLKEKPLDKSSNWMDDKPKSKITASNLFVAIRSKLLNLLL